MPNSFVEKNSETIRQKIWFGTAAVSIDADANTVFIHSNNGLSSNYFSGDGSALTNLNASSLNFGTISETLIPDLSDLYLKLAATQNVITGSKLYFSKVPLTTPPISHTNVTNNGGGIGYDYFEYYFIVSSPDGQVVWATDYWDGEDDDTTSIIINIPAAVSGLTYKLYRYRDSLGYTCKLGQWTSSNLPGTFNDDFSNSTYEDATPAATYAPTRLLNNTSNTLRLDGMAVSATSFTGSGAGLTNVPSPFNQTLNTNSSVQFFNLIVQGGPYQFGAASVPIVSFKGQTAYPYGGPTDLGNISNYGQFTLNSSLGFSFGPQGTRQSQFKFNQQFQQSGNFPISTLWIDYTQQFGQTGQDSYDWGTGRICYIDLTYYGNTVFAVDKHGRLQWTSVNTEGLYRDSADSALKYTTSTGQTATVAPTFKGYGLTILSPANATVASIDGSGNLTVNGTTTLQNTIINGLTLPYGIGTPFSPRNAFGSATIYQSDIHNFLFEADKRFSVTATGFTDRDSVTPTNYLYPSLFNGSYEQSHFCTPANGTSVVTIDFTAKGNGTLVYCQGELYVAFYYTEVPASISVRVQDNTGVWYTCTGITNVARTGSINYYVPIAINYYLNTVEITVTGPASGFSSLNQVEYHLGRPSSSALPVCDKFRPQSIYENWSWNDSNNVAQIGIAPSGTLTANGLITAGSLHVTSTAQIDTSLQVGSLEVGFANGGNTNVAFGAETGRNQITFPGFRDVVGNVTGAKIVGINTNHYAAGSALVQYTDLAFYTLNTNPAVQDATTEKMRLTSSGNLMLNTTTGTGVANIEFLNTDGVTSGLIIKAKTGNSDTNDSLPALKIVDSSNVTRASINAFGGVLGFGVGTIGGSVFLSDDSNPNKYVGMNLASGSEIGWNSTTSYYGTKVLRLYKDASNNLVINGNGLDLYGNANFRGTSNFANNITLTGSQKIIKSSTSQPQSSSIWHTASSTKWSVNSEIDANGWGNFYVGSSSTGNFGSMINGISVYLGGYDNSYICPPTYSGTGGLALGTQNAGGYGLYVNNSANGAANFNGNVYTNGEFHLQNGYSFVFDDNLYFYDNDYGEQIVSICGEYGDEYGLNVYGSFHAYNSAQFDSSASFNGTSVFYANAYFYNTISAASNAITIAAWNGAGNGGAWINMPTASACGIGTGGAGSNPWIGYAAAAGQWFSNSASGDVCYRNSTRILMGCTGGGNSQLILSSSGIAISAGLTITGSTSMSSPLTMTSRIVQSTTVVTGTTQTINATNCNNINFTATANTTLTLSNGIDNQSIRLRFIQGGSAGYALTITNANFGTGVTDLSGCTQSTVGKYAYVGLVFNGTSSKWDVVSLVGGYS